ncbi:hypothetical protein ABTM48_19830, partial [Acinetobacter baumannii]
TYLPGREFTVGIVGTGAEASAVGAMEILFAQTAPHAVYGFECKTSLETSPSYALASDGAAAASIDVALQAWRALGCRDAGRVDVRLDADG